MDEVQIEIISLAPNKSRLEDGKGGGGGAGGFLVCLQESLKISTIFLLMQQENKTAEKQEVLYIGSA